MVQFTKLRLTGFKSFVDSTELVIDSGLTGIVGIRIEGYPVSRTDWKLAGARDHGAGIRVNALRPVLGPSGPRPDGDAAIGGALGQSHPGSTKADRCGNGECEHRSEKQTHVGSDMA